MGIDWRDDATRTLEKSVANAVDSPEADRVSQRVVEGHPAQVLLDAAADAALLVVGSRGRGGFRGMLLGSVSQDVVARAACPVVVVPRLRVPTGVTGPVPEGGLGDSEGHQLRVPDPVRTV